MNKKKAKPRRDRQWPQAARVLSTNFPDGFNNVKGKCFVPLDDFRKLERRYLRMFDRYRRRVLSDG